MQNPHPLAVHFPLALLIVAALGALVAAVTKSLGVSAFARATLYLGTFAATAAVISGFLAEQSVAKVASAHGVLERHETLGYFTLGVAAALSGWSFVEWRRRRRDPRPAPLWIAGHIALLTLVVLTGQAGGSLVHEHGVGTKLTAPGGPLHERDRGAGGDLERTVSRRDSVPTARDFR